MNRISEPCIPIRIVLSGFLRHEKNVSGVSEGSESPVPVCALSAVPEPMLQRSFVVTAEVISERVVAVTQGVICTVYVLQRLEHLNLIKSLSD